MDLLEVPTIRPMGRPGTKEHQPILRRISPQACAAVSAGSAQELDLRKGLTGPRVTPQDLLDSSIAHDPRASRGETVTRIDAIPQMPAPAMRGAQLLESRTHDGLHCLIAGLGTRDVREIDRRPKDDSCSGRRE